jgi:hypothetical protein
MKKIAIQALFVLLMASLLLLISACSVSVDDKDKKDGKVDIQTPFANLKVDSTDKAVDNGIPVYPGAHRRPEENGDNHGANINIGAMGFGLKVIAVEYETDDSPEKVKAFYEDKMKAFGTPLVCNGHSSDSDVHISDKKDKDDKKLNCSDSSGNGWEIKTGTSDNQHLVSIEPHAGGTRFGTVFIQTRGKREDTL